MACNVLCLVILVVSIAAAFHTRVLTNVSLIIHGMHGMPFSVNMNTIKQFLGKNI